MRGMVPTDRDDAALRQYRSSAVGEKPETAEDGTADARELKQAVPGRYRIQFFTRRIPMATAPVKAATSPSTNKLVTLGQFNSQIEELESRYGLRLSCEITRNVNNGDVNQWIGKVWCHDGVPQIITPAIGTTFEGMLNTLITELTLTLK